MNTALVLFCLNNNMRSSCKSLAESQWLRKRDAIESNSKFYLYIESFRRVRLRLVFAFAYSFFFPFWHRHHSQFISIKVLFDVCCRRCCCCFFESCHYYPLLLLKHKFQTLVKHYILSGCFFFSRWIALGFASRVRLHTHIYHIEYNYSKRCSWEVRALTSPILLILFSILLDSCFVFCRSLFFILFFTFVRRILCVRTSLFCMVYVSIFFRYNLKWA